LVNASPEPFSNIAVSTGEDVATAGLLGLAIANPVAAALIALLLVILSIWLVLSARRLLRGVLEPKRPQGLKSAIGGMQMPVSEKSLVERIARVLAGAKLSSNAEGSNGSAGPDVDRTWREHVNQALAVLHTLREPDERMAAAGDAEVWRKMVESAIAERVD
jgi:hypothetical protein